MRWLPWLALTIMASCFVDRPVAKLVKAGVELRKVTAFEAPTEQQSSVVVAPGDFVLSGAGMRVVIGGLRRDQELRGSVLEAMVEGVAVTDSIVLLSPRVYVEGVARPIRIDRMFMVERKGAPALRVEGVVRLRDRVVQLARELSLGRAAGTLAISTRLVTYEPEGERNVRLGARIAWGGPRPFVPGVGELADEQWHRAPWVGSEGATGSACFGYHQGTLAVRAVFEHRGANALLLHTEITQARGIELKSGVPHYEKAALALTSRGVAHAVRTFGHFRGRPYPEAWVHLPYRPPGAQVELRDARGAFLLRGRPDERGRVVLPLGEQGMQQEKFEAIATAYGHAPSDAVLLGGGEPRMVELTIPRGGRIRVRVRDADSDLPISARVRLVALEQAPPPALGPDYRASGAGDTVIALAGDLSIDVPPGRYRAIVTHGPEWSLHEADVEVSETFSPRVEAELEHQVDPSSWVACDLHVHSAPSPDSEVTLEDRLASLAAEGIGFAVATDHNHVTDFGPTAQLMSLEGTLRTMTGVEVTTWEPHLGHFNAYPYPLDPKRPDNGAPDRMHTDPRVLFRLLHAVDPELVVQVNHPRSEGGIGYFDVMHYDPVTGRADPTFSSEFDALEVYNGFDLAVPEKLEQVFTDFLHILERGQRIAATGSSDSHQVRYQLAGYPRTYAFVPPELGTDTRAIVRAIKAGSSFVTTGPFLEVSVGGGGPGTTVQAINGKVTLAVRVQAPSWMDVSKLEVFVGKERVVERAIAPLPARKKKGRVSALKLDVADIELEVKSDTFVIVRVSGDAPNDAFFGRFGIKPRAFTNPIFVDVDGDGETPWLPPGSAPRPQLLEDLRQPVKGAPERPGAADASAG